MARYRSLSLSTKHGRGSSWMQILFNPSVFWPTLIISGQLFFVLAGWTFFIYNTRQPTALSDLLAEQARKYPPAVTFIVTFLSTNISIASSYLHSHAVRYALACRLSKPMPLHHLSVGIKIARQRTVVSWRFLKWTIVTGITLGLLGAQTTAWSTLLTPSTISLPVKLTGREVDVSNSEFYNLLANMIREGRIRPDEAVAVAQTVQASGVAAVNAEFDLPGDVLNFNRISFTNSTGGIMPVFLRDVQSVLMTESHYPSTITIHSASTRSPKGFDTSFEMIQQGLTVQTTCKPRDPVGVRELTQFAEIATIPLMAVGIEVNCTNGSVDRPDLGEAVITRVSQGETEGNTILAAACALEHNGGYEFVIHSVGDLYTFIQTLSCEMVPKITTVRVKYSESSTDEGPYAAAVSITEVISEREIDDPVFAVAPFTFLKRGFQTGQSWWGSTFGNTVSEIVVSDKAQARERLVQQTTEAYLTGIFEFSATLVQFALTYTNNSLFPDAIPDSMKHDTTGTLFIETMGWDFRPKRPVSNEQPEPGSPSIAAPALVAAVLIIPTLVAISAIAFTIIGIVTSRRERASMLQYQEHLDMGDFLQVMSITHPELDFPTLDGSEGEFMQACKDVNLRARLQKDQRDQIEMILIS